MRRNTYIPPPFHLGDRFVDGKKRAFEIIETHWNIPGQAVSESRVSMVIDLVNGHRIILNGPPSQLQMTAVGFKQEGTPDSPLVVQPVEKMLELIESRLISRLW